MDKHPTAAYQRILVAGGSRYKFYCDISGALVCTTENTYRAEPPERECLLAWETEGKGQFNYCCRCGRWVMDAMFNPEVMECVDCAPFEEDANFCKTCGAKVQVPGRSCQACGNALRYEGRLDRYDIPAP